MLLLSLLMRVGKCWCDDSCSRAFQSVDVLSNVRRDNTRALLQEDVVRRIYM